MPTARNVLNDLVGNLLTAVSTYRIGGLKSIFRPFWGRGTRFKIEELTLLQFNNVQIVKTCKYHVVANLECQLISQRNCEIARLKSIRKSLIIL